MPELETNEYDKTKGSHPQAQSDPRADIKKPTEINKDILLKKKKGDKKYGSNQDIPEVNAQNPDQTNGPEIGRSSKKPDEPTIASVTPNYSVHSAIKSSNPQNKLGTGAKVIEGILMIKMIDSLSSPAGLSSIAGGVLGSVFQQLGNLFGIPNVMNMLNNATSQLNSFGLSSNLIRTAMSMGISALSSGSGSGVFSSANISEMTNLVSSIGSSGIGGPTAGLDPASIQYQLATLPVGTPTNIIARSDDGTNVLHSAVATVPFPTSGFPSFTGTESSDIATSQINIVLPILSNMIASTNSIDVINFSSLINNLMNNIQGQGLKAILGSGAGDIFGNAISILGSIGGLLQKNGQVNIASILTRLGFANQISTISQQNAIIKMAIAKKKYQIAQSLIHSGSATAADAVTESGAINQTAKTGEKISWQDSIFVNHTTTLA